MDSTSPALGEVIKEYPNPRLKRALISLVAGIAIMAIFLNLGEGLRGNNAYLIFIGLILAAFGFFGLPMAFLNIGNKAVVYQNGFTYTHKGNNKTVFWDEIVDVAFDRRTVMGGLIGVMGSENVYILKLRNKGTAVISSANISKVEEIGERARREMQARVQK